MSEGCGEPITRMVTALLEVDGKLLLVKGGGAATRGGLWEFPGGLVELGESLEEALRREIRGAIDVELAPEMKFIGWADFDLGDRMLNLFGYVCRPQDPARLPQGGAYQLLDPSEIQPHLLTPPDQHLLEVFIKSRSPQ